MRVQPTKAVILAASVACVFLTSFALSSYSVFLPAILKEFPWSRADAVLPFTIAMIAWGITQPFGGSMADARGSRPVILGGLAILALGFAIMGLSQSLWQLAVGFGLVVGTAMSACGTIMFSLLIQKWFSATARASAAGIMHSAVSASAIISAPLLFFAITSFGWRASAFAYTALLMAISFPLAYIFLHDPKKESSEVLASPRWTVREELRAIALLAPLRNVFLVRMACGLGFGLIVPHLGTAAIAVGLTPADGAFALSVYGGFGVFCTFLSGLAADRWGRSRTIVVTLALRALGTMLLALPSMDRPIFFLAAALACGPISATFSINNIQVFELVGAKRAGLVLGLSVVLHQVAAAVGPFVTGLIFDWVGSYTWPFVGLAVFMLLSTIPAARSGARPSQFRHAPIAADAQ